MQTGEAPVAPAPAPKKKRGRESVTDMVRSLGLVLVVVIAAWWLAQPPDSDEQSIRVVDTSRDIAQLQRETPGVPVPTVLPAGWRSTVNEGLPGGLRLGYVTPGEQYVEYAVSVSSPPTFLSDITGRGTEVGVFDVGAVTWRQFQNDDGATTLVRTVGASTVAVGGVRETTSLDELRALAASIKP